MHIDSNVYIVDTGSKGCASIPCLQDTCTIWPNNVCQDPKPIIETYLAEEEMALERLYIQL
jgi:hypothetical protein